MWKVECWEFERGWGSRLDSTEKFETYEDAKEFQEKFNSYNTAAKVPDWYMIAENPQYKPRD